MKLKKRLNIIVTAGPTREPIDPVRFISNYSTGYLGYAIAREARARGHKVILISGPSAVVKPKGVRLIEIETCRQMDERLKENFNWCDCLIMAAAICDFRAKKAGKRKIKRSGKNELTLRLAQSPDILKGLGRKKNRKLLVGVALETENLKKNAQDKLRQKNLDLIVATQMKRNAHPFGKARLDVLIMDRKDRIQKVRKATKRRLSGILFDSIEKAA